MFWEPSGNPQSASRAYTDGNPKGGVEKKGGVGNFRSGGLKARIDLSSKSEWRPVG